MKRIFSLAAVQHADGSASGNFELIITDPVGGSENPAIFTLAARVTCVTVAANRAWVGGVITSSSNPDFVGGQAGWSVKDRGDGPAGRDLISLVDISTTSPDFAQGICDGEIPRNAVLPVQSGNVRVEFADFFEGFSGFADGAVPTASHPMYFYAQNDALENVTVRVAGSSGALADRPLVLTKQSAATPGAPNFIVGNTQGLLADVSTGTIRIAADVQVNGGTFCSFFGVRAPTSAPASVHLHDLSYQVGVPFSMVLVMDVEAGTISATKDGAPVPVTVSDGGTRTTGETVAFPYMPFRFGFESCFQSEQSYAVDNLRMEWDRR